MFWALHPAKGRRGLIASAKMLGPVKLSDFGRSSRGLCRGIGRRCDPSGLWFFSENPDFVDACQPPASPSSALIGHDARAWRQGQAPRRYRCRVRWFPATEVLGDDMDAIKRQMAANRLSADAEGQLGGGGAACARSWPRGTARKGPRGPARGRGRLWQWRGYLER